MRNMILCDIFCSRQRHFLAPFLATSIGLILTACAGPEPARTAIPAPTVLLEDDHSLDSDAEGLASEEADEWLSFEQMLDQGAPAANSTPEARAASASGSTREPSSGPIHAIVLRTFQDDTSGATAHTWSAQLGTLVPPLKPDLRVHIDSKGSVVVFGNYDGWDDPQAAEDMGTLKDLRVNGKKIFGAIIRTTITPARDPDHLHPHELLTLRKRYPKARTIYTLEIEIWGDFESGELPRDIRLRRAEERVKELRAAGITAYFHHDPISELSTITVGAFDETAIDSSSGIPSREVEMLQKQFPNRLTNGEQLALPIKGRSDLGAVPQRSRLVLVPEL
jgi:hypothetical protein